MKKYSSILRLLLLVLLSQALLPLSFGQRLKNEVTHLRVIGDDKNLNNSCDDYFWAEDELIIEVSMVNLRCPIGPFCNEYVLPIACLPMYVAAYNEDSGDFLGVSEQISTFTISPEVSECNGHSVEEYPTECGTTIYSAQIVIPINLSNYCIKGTNCQEVTIHYELVTPRFTSNPPGSKEWLPYIEAASAVGCTEIIFPIDCFCHYQGDNAYQKATQSIRYICPTFGDPAIGQMQEMTSEVQSQASATSIDLARVPQQMVEEPNFMIFPNPTDDYLIIGFSSSVRKNLTIHLLNSGGQIVLSLEDLQLDGENRVRLDMTNLPAGIYFCRIYDGKSITSQKIMKFGR